VSQDYAEGIKWLRKAAQMGNDMAQCSLGNFIARGIGVTQNYIEAYKWLNLSAAQGNADAAKVRDIVSSNMTQSQIAEGQRLAAEFILGKEAPKNQGEISSNSTSPENPRATATGFIITDDGYLISNYHVV
jgi:TPR repeat protein